MAKINNHILKRFLRISKDSSSVTYVFLKLFPNDRISNKNTLKNSEISSKSLVLVLTSFPIYFSIKFCSC